MTNQIALVTGANGGIGSKITEELVKAGYRVIAGYYPSEKDRATAWINDAKYTQDEVRLLPLDVTDAEHCQEVLTALWQEEGQIDVLVNNAGITRDALFKRMNFEQWDAVIKTNLNSLFYVTHPLFTFMCEKGSCRIINMTSVNGLKGQFGQVNYSAAKAGVIGFTKALAAEGAKFGVTVNAVAPGYTNTSMVSVLKPEVIDSICSTIPMKRLAEPSEIAAAVVFLASENAQYITGETLSVNGGLYMH
ncbi:SDR family NAD(P)-dependent oxidoreductase [Photobacterium kishitanii]|uniref:SDR family NAD(P)-dependent oxidoreductase n=1 Tax=Photobacterium kishitanii TaxID=318456 RepID=A0A0B7JEH8_9GAMM|nr:SDR family oxidoreductase [Photobacterium kishitanii]OBU23967.1 beta-ketoacyl-ACP reductase [Photobacterium kishitanii]PSU89672.1 SDR family NAD(P)-dependent oxidoreductase [Photobacterium kishitanii]PSU91585.1 SDR family NAD(P)-dependent oxidoreductase [Photobacterium kishitanii]PSU95422.1 SDR family NAD(P)-dependent oxidoreductase [Photobacterium kishitanii]PSV24719.1 SDR family NAD(P)-dependent oxidoreductase [Photobacterium kishitanii]